MTKSRKRILLSSIAMLLVALVALGSATFAWFTISKTVSASGMQVTARTEAGLEITKDSGANWSASTVAFGTSHNELNLVSCDTKTPTLSGFFPGNVVSTGVWTTNSTTITDFKAVASTEDVSALTIPASNDATDSTKYFAAYQVQVRSKAPREGAQAVTRNNLTAKVTISGDGADYVRVAVLDGGVTSTTVKATYGSETNPTAVKSVSEGTPTLETQTLTASGNTVALASTIGGTAQTYTLLCWFEGQDAQAVDTHDNVPANISIEFSYAS